MFRTTLAALSLAAVTAAQVSLTHISTIDVSSTSNGLNPEYIGNNPMAVAWNGTDLFLAGFNSTGAVGNVGIVKISNALTTPTPGIAFGVVGATPNVRGYTGLDIAGTKLVAAYDPGAVSPVGITGWDLTGTSLWAKNGRGGSGVAMDPGFVGVDFGVGWTTFGSGRRALQGEVTGADIYTSANGMIMNPTPSPGTTWRDMDFDTLSGDIWLRMGNKVLAATRVGGNVLVNQRVVVDATLAIGIVAQNLSFVRQPAGEVVFWNNRVITTAGQPFAAAVLCNRASDGAAMTLSWGAFAPAAGIGAYDFSYDEASKTMAISDFANRSVYVFQVTVAAPYDSGCPGQGGVTPALAVTGSAHANGTLTFALTGAAPLSLGLFAFGDSAISVPLPFPFFCNLLVSPLILIDGIFVTPPGLPGSGSGTFNIPVPPGVTGLNLTAQGFVMENIDLNQLVTSNGVFAVML